MFVAVMIENKTPHVLDYYFEIFSHLLTKQNIVNTLTINKYKYINQEPEFQDGFPNLSMFNPLVMNGLSNPYQLDESTFIFKH